MPAINNALNTRQVFCLLARWASVLMRGYELR
jgi:hypothetical protein